MHKVSGRHLICEMGPAKMSSASSKRHQWRLGGGDSAEEARLRSGGAQEQADGLQKS